MRRDEFCLDTSAGYFCLTQLPKNSFECPKCNQSFDVANLIVPQTEITSPLTKNRYLVEKFINRGGMANVYRGSTQWGQHSVIKENRLEETNLRRLPISTLISLNHPNLVQYLDGFNLNFRDYVVQDYIIGQDLYGFTLNEAELVCLAQTTSHPLTYLHTQDRPIFHLDITPGNIVLTSNRQPVLIDLEGGVFSTTSQDQVSSVGTEGFAAIEQDTSMNKPVGPFTDVYGLAATMYYLATNEIPISAMQRLEMLSRYQRDPLEAIFTHPNLSKNLAFNLAEGLALHPGNRPQSVSDFIKTLTSTKMYMRGY